MEVNQQDLEKCVSFLLQRNIMAYHQCLWIYKVIVMVLVCKSQIIISYTLRNCMMNHKNTKLQFLPSNLYTSFLHKKDV